MKILGIDPGIAGAVAVIEIINGVDGIAPKLVDVIDLPVLGTKPPSAFQLIRKIMTSFPPNAGEHTEVSSVKHRSA